MKRILLFCLCTLLCSGIAGAVVRDNNAVNRPKNNTSQQSRGNTTAQKVTVRTATTPTTAREVSGRETNVSRAATTTTVSTRDVSSKQIQTPIINRSAINTRRTAAVAPAVIARAATEEGTSVETRTGAAYEQCKNAYFGCMDQFCTLKNDDYRRCSCSDRVYDLQDIRTVMQDAGEKLTVFSEGLDAIGMTAAQATAMRTASEGENALTADGSASKALLQAIMNSIRGQDSNVGGKYADLNSINMSFDTANAFGTMDAGQAVAAYNGKNLYTAIYGQCRNAVRSECNDASLQRAVTAYLMAIEQDCNTVQTKINDNQKKMTAAVRESSAMLDLARIENRQKHNSDDMTACLHNVELSVLSEEVCGAGYRKCLDNGEFIDITTGKPIAGVVRFYELEGLLKFSDGTALSDQRLSKTPSNRGFVQNFEKRVKKFAAPALDKCTEKAGLVWEDYLDKAMLDIYYAQKSKVSEIKQGCFDFVSSCYVNGDSALTAAMTGLMGETAVILQPDRIAVNSAVCREYVDSCNNMFDGNIVAQYVAERKDTDTLTACRAVAKQCFDKFGGASYENFYYPFSGLFISGEAPKWFTLYKYNKNEEVIYVSECAKQLAQVPSCSSKEMMEKAFGGFDQVPVMTDTVLDNEGNPTTVIKYDPTEVGTAGIKYGLVKIDESLANRSLRPTGVATEIYNQVIDILTTQCLNLQGRFVELQFLKENFYDPDNICISDFIKPDASAQRSVAFMYGVFPKENMCPKNYELSVDMKSWGACNCWENGARRSRNGTTVTCQAELPMPNYMQGDDHVPSGPGYFWDWEAQDGARCINGALISPFSSTLNERTNLAVYQVYYEAIVGSPVEIVPVEKWCTPFLISELNQVCPLRSGIYSDPKGRCQWDSNISATTMGIVDPKDVPEGVR